MHTKLIAAAAAAPHVAQGALPVLDAAASAASARDDVTDADGCVKYQILI